MGQDVTWPSILGVAEGAGLAKNLQMSVNEQDSVPHRWVDTDADVEQRIQQ
jgi:hypothetical protein